MATAPKRDPLWLGEPARPHAPARPQRAAGPVDRPRREPLDKRAWNKAVLLLNVALIAAVGIVALQHLQADEGPERAVESGPIVSSTLPDPDAEPLTEPVAEPVATPSDPPTAAPGSHSTMPMPAVRTRMRVSFTKGEGWPVGAGFRETGGVSWPLGVVDRLMTHGPPEGPDAVSWLEKWMKTDVRRLGARVLFAPNHSGAAALTVWHTSVLDTSGLEQPRTGMRLVVTPGTWRLDAIDATGTVTLATGSYVPSGRSAAFDLVRRADTAWVTDPSGTVTAVTDERVASLSGPWASWELREDNVSKRPAALQEVWAG